MEVTFWGVRGSIAAPGPATVRYGGNTSCVSVKLAGGHLVILDCGTGARNLGLQLLGGAFGQGKGRATFLLSHAHWDHIQGFPFFGPFYVAGNSFTIHGGDRGNVALEQILEGQMAAQYFPVQTTRNMGATISMRAMAPGEPLAVEDAVVRAHANPHGTVPALAFRLEDAGRVLTYASDAGYGGGGPSPEALEICAGADLLIHDSTYSPEDRALGASRGLSSLDDAVDCAVKAGVKKLALFHYDQDYSDREVDDLVLRGRRMLDDRGGRSIEIVGAAEGLTLAV